MGIFNKIKAILSPQKVTSVFGLRAESSADMADEICAWRDIYKGQAHWVGEGKEQVKSVGVATAIINDLATKCVSEITLTEEPCTLLANFFEDEIKQQIRQQLEYALALGAVVVRPYYDAESNRIALSWYTADRFIPTQWSGKRCIGGVFVDYLIREDGGKKVYYIKLESHKWRYGKDGVGGSVVIEVKAFKSSFGFGLEEEIGLAEVVEWADIPPMQEVYEIDFPLFVYAPTPFSNNKNLNSKQGVSIYKDAEAIIERIDRTWDDLNWELDSSANKVFISQDILNQQYDDDGRRFTPMNSKEQRLYETLDTPACDGKPIDIYSPAIRQADITAVLKTNISLLCSVMHLDSGAYVYEENGQAVTATEVTAKQQKTYQTICDIQQWLVTPLIKQTVEVVRMYQHLYGLAMIPEQDIIVDYGDSILTDEETARQTAIAEVTNGVRSKMSYLMEYRQMTEEEAQKEIALIEAEKPKTVDFFGGA